MFWCAVGEYRGPRILNMFMRYVGSKIAQRQEETAYRIYITDALLVIGENTKRFAGGSSMKVRYADILYPKPEETRTAEEIKQHFISKLGGEQS